MLQVTADAGEHSHHAASGQFTLLHALTMPKTEAKLGSLHRLLNHHSRALTSLRQNAASPEDGSFEDRLPVLDCRIMQLYFQLTNEAVPSQARSALPEMASLAGALANRVAAPAEVWRTPE
jgi:hypothetical protein